MDELKRNGSGYYDETAYKAMKRVERKEKMDIKKGEIWEVAMNGGNREMLCIKAFEKYAVGLLLSPEETEENCIMVKSRTKMYADTGRTIYAYNHNIRNYIKTLPEDDIEYVMIEIAKTLGLESQATQEEQTQNQPKLEPFSGELYTKMQSRLEAERDIYKEMYEKLVEKMIRI